VLGARAGAGSLPPARGVPVVDALEAVMVTALQRPPCLVSFSGGRDSSAILAVAVATARRHGLDDPVPATLRFPDSPESEESEWREVVLRHLGISERLVIDVHDELDALGPVAVAALQHHGVRFPSNAHMHVPILEAARGGSVVTGVGGDELFATRGSRAVLLLHRRVSPRWRDLAGVPLSLMPRTVRVLEHRVRRSESFPYLTTAGARMVNAAIADDEVQWPHRWNATVRYWFTTRVFRALNTALAVLGADHDVQVTNPFLAPTVLVEVVRVGGPTGFESRTRAMAELFGQVLPSATLSRPSKASFGPPFFGVATRAFAEVWDGSGVDRRLVDVERLRNE